MSDHGNAEYEGFYKMFPLPGTPFKDEVFVDLLNTPLSRAGNTPVPAGYTYLGQFVTHEITRLGRGDQVPKPKPVSPSELRQLRSPSLDLDSLYGSVTGFGSEIPNAYGRFESEATHFINGQELIYDFPRSGGTATIGDPRNDENFIVAQLQVLFMNVHNKLVGLYEAFEHSSPADAARKELTLLFQKIVEQDFLARLLDKQVHQKLFIHPLKEFLLHVTEGEESRIPIEFAGAVFRFGHSMVRRFYLVNETSNLRLDSLFELTGPGGGWECIKRENRILDWQFQFDLSAYKDPVVFDRTFPLDTSLAAGLRKMANEPEGLKDLAARNLRRSLELDLPCGQDIVKHLLSTRSDYCQEMGLNLIDTQGIDERNFAFRKIVDKWALSEKMPLWTYILVEPHFASNEIDKHTRLGALGSVIIGEVFRALLTTSRTSIYSENLTLTESAFLSNMEKRFPKKGLSWNNVTMPDLVAFIHC